jgi:integrase
LLITHTKFLKSRVVPVHPTTAEKLTAYLKQRGGFGDPTAFFVSLRGRPLYRLAVWRVFQTLCRRAGIRKTADGRRPTLHGFRHTFAVNRLLSWYREGLDIKSCLPHLSVYMGHVEPAYTYWYLSATPDLLRLAADSFERYANQEGGVR